MRLAHRELDKNSFEYQHRIDVIGICNLQYVISSKSYVFYLIS
jgi:hypothetical protein